MEGPIRLTGKSEQAKKFKLSVDDEIMLIPVPEDTVKTINH
jgi:hypothetical protein